MDAGRIWSGKVIAAVGGVIAVLVSLTLGVTFAKFDRNLGLVRVTEKVQREVSRVHLWFEERLSGDESVDIETDVRGPFRSLIDEYQAFLKSDDLDAIVPGQASQLKELESRLVEFGRLLDERWEYREQSRTGSESDVRFDHIYRQVLSISDELAAATDRLIEGDRRTLIGTDIAIIGLVLLLFVALAIMVHRSRRELEERNVELERRVAERTAELRALNDELVVARDAAQSAGEAKSRFLANLSHEIRTPLNAVIGTASLLMDRATPSSRRQLETIQDGSESLLYMLDSILDFSRGEAGKLEIRVETFDLRLLLEAVTRLFRESAHAKGLELRSIEHLEVHRLRGDAGRLRQVMANLLSNAVKFTDEGSVEVAIRSTERGDRVAVVIEVSDTGPGISEKDRERVFQPFTQLDSSTTRQHGGTGLGLAICQQIVQQMGGRVEFASEVGRGTRFVVTLELDAAAEREHSPGPGEGAAAGARVLVVDDNEINLRVVPALLRELHATVQTAAGGEQALEILRQSPDLDLVLLDAHMPGLSGTEVVQRWRAERATEGTAGPPIVALTAEADSGARERFLLAGFDGYLSKPITMERLRDLLRHWMGRDRDVVSRGPSRSPEDLATGSDRDGVVDPQRFRDLATLGGGHALRDQLLEVFESETPAVIDAIEDAASRGDLDGVRANAHRLRSSAGQMGADRLARRCRLIEESDALAPVAEVRRLFELSVSAMRSLHDASEHDTTLPDDSDKTEGTP